MFKNYKRRIALRDKASKNELLPERTEQINDATQQSQY